MTLGVGVANKEFYVQWNQPENWSKVIINLGSIAVGIHFLVWLDHIYLGAHWKKLLSVRDVAAQRYEHGFIYKTLQSLSDIT